jgi:hypothetical protein
MVGLKPPLPRSYPFFRFSTAFATILLTLTFAANLAAPRLKYVGPNTGWGGGYGGGPAAPQASAPMLESLAATEAPAAMDEAVPAIMQTPAPTLEAPASALEMEAMPTQMADSAATEAPTAKQMDTPPEAFAQPSLENQPGAEVAVVEPTQSQPLIPVVWQAALFILILLSGLTAFLLRRSAIQKWK